MRHVGASARIALLVVVLAGLAGGGAAPGARAQDGSRYFAETGHTVSGAFLAYWDAHGGLAQQGYPLTEAHDEVSDTDGKTYTVQYFERAVFERHPENAAPYDTLLSLLGVFEYRQRYGPGGAPGQHASATNPRVFPETGHTVGGAFRAYWESHGGLAQQGYPLSDEFTEVSPLDGKPHTVQYFQRAVFERHPENAGTPYEVLLSQLGTFRYRARTSSFSIPAPGPGRAQYAPQGDGPYLAWAEVGGQPEQSGAQIDLRALDTRSNTLHFVADVKGPSADFALSGSLLVWHQQRECAPTCPGLDLLGRDFATGQSYRIASEIQPLSRPAVSGRRVAYQTDSGRSLLLIDLSTMQVTPVVTGSVDSNEYLARPALSDEYLAWFAIDQQGERGARLRLFSYALATGQTQVVVDKQLAELGLEPPLAISGHRVAWADPTPHTLDLQTGKAMDLGPSPADSMAVRGLTTVWSAKGGPNGRDMDVWGYRQGDAAPTLLASGAGNQTGVTLAGDWLVWENQGGPQDQRLSAAALDAAFAHPAAPPPDAAAPAQAIGVTQFSQAWAGGHFVFWLEYHNPLSTLLGRDLTTGRQWTLTGALDPIAAVATDGRQVVWLEQDAAGAKRLAGYDLTASAPLAGLPEVPPFPAGIEELALDNGMLYYTGAPAVAPDAPGLYGGPLPAGPFTRVRPGRELHPVAHEGALLWQDEQLLPGKHPVITATLYLRTAQTPPDGLALPAPTGGQGGWDVSADHVVWSDLAPTATLHLYTVATGALTTLATNTTSPRTRGDWVAWAEDSRYGGFGGTVWARNLRTGVTRLVAGGVPGSAQVVGIVDGPAVVFTGDPPAPISQRLFVAPLTP